MDPFDVLFRPGRSSRFMQSIDPSWTPQERPIGTDNIQPGGFIEPGAVTDASFAASIDPVLVVTTIPPIPDTYAIDRVAILTTDHKLYRKTGVGTWTRSTDGADIIADSVTAGQIAAGAISTSELAAGAVSADKLLVGSARPWITNGDFEAGSGVGWTFVQNSGSGGSSGIGNDPLWRSQGAYYMTLTPGSGEYEMSQIVQGFRYNDVVHLSFLAANATSMYVAVEWHDGSGVGINSWVSSPFTPGGGYNGSGPTRYNFVTSAAPAGTASARLIVRVTTGSTLLIDDIVLTRTADSITPDGNVVINSSGVAITNGKLTVTNGLSTVIIDGQSDMFKIVASGTASVIGTGAGSIGTTDVTLTALGSGYTNTPAFLSLISSSATGASALIGRLLVSVEMFVAATSGGAVTTKVRAITEQTDYAVLLSAGQVVVRLQVENNSGGSMDRYGRYFVFSETAF